MIKHKTKLWYQYIRSRTKSNLFKYTKAVVKPDSRCYDAHIKQREVISMDEQRLIDIETALANQERTLDELSRIVYEQGKEIDRLVKLNKYLRDMIDKDVVKPETEETPPPHY